MRILPLVVVIAFGAAVALGEPAYDDAKALFDAGDYKACLAKIAAAIPTSRSKPVKPPKGEERKPDPLYSYYMLRAECQLRLKVRGEALEAFQSAADVAATAQELSPAWSMVWLLQESPKLVYPPNDPAGKEFIDPEPRAAAMAMLFNKRMDAAAPLIQKAESAKSAGVIRDILPKLADLRLLEMATGQDDSRVAVAAQPLASRILDLIKPDLGRLQKRNAQLKKLGSSKVQYIDHLGYIRHRPRGYTNWEKAELKERIADLREFRLLVQAARELSSDTQATARWGDVEQALNETITHTKSTLGAF